MQKTAGAEPLLPVVLIVEDAEFNLHAERITLESHGFVVITTDEGASAPMLAQMHRPALVILDLNLPDVNGITVIWNLKATEATREIPILVCSADGREETIRSCREAGIADFLVKPFSAEELIEAVEGVLEEPGSEPDPDRVA